MKKFLSPKVRRDQFIFPTVARPVGLWERKRWMYCNSSNEVVSSNLLALQLREKRILVFHEHFLGIDFGINLSRCVVIASTVQGSVYVKIMRGGGGIRDCGLYRDFGDR